MKISKCHPEIPHQARGLCQKCYYLENKIKIYLRTKAYAKTPKGLEIQKRAGHKYYLKTFRKKKYGLTHDQIRAMVEEQNGKCAICYCVPKKFCVDHCHLSGQTRGLLCNNCNLAIGLMKESIPALLNAIQYLRKDIL